MLKWILGFLLGCCSIFWLSEPISIIDWALTISVFITLLVITGRFGDMSPSFQAINQCLMGFCLGLLWLQVHSEHRLHQRITQPLTDSHIIKAKLLSIPQVYDGLLQFRAKIIDSDTKELLGKKLKFSWYRYQDSVTNDEELPKLGDNWQFKVRVKPIVSALNKAGYDAEKQSFLNGIAGRATIASNHAIKLSNAPAYSISAIRQSLYDKLKLFQNAGLFQALIIGEKSAISDEQRASIQALGISHLVAISGLHISIIAGLFFWLGLKVSFFLNRLGVTVSALFIAAAISFVAALVYSALAGFSVATVRALIMWLIVVIALITSNQKQLFRSLCVAMLVILIIDPISVLSYGFWLTFAAIAIIGMVLVGRVIPNSKILLAIKTQWAISLGMALLVVSMFQQLSLIAFVINLILIPIFSFVVLPLVFIAVVVKIAFRIDFILQWIDFGFSNFFNLFKVDFFQQSGLFIDLYFGPIIYLLLLMAFIFYVLPIGKLRFLFVINFIIIALGLHLCPQKNLEYKLVVFDVGHGLANLIFNDEISVLYDTGFANEGFSYAQATLIPSLRALGINSIDLLVVSHNDLDHSGGLKAINKAFPIRMVVDVDSCLNNKNMNFSGLTLNFYQSRNAQHLKSNNQSCVVQAISERRTVLFTGDIEKESELDLLKQDINLKSDILISPHHGSNTSSQYPFIKRVAADLVIHSTDRFNRFGFPKTKVMQRYNEMNYEQLSTGCTGMIEINLNNDQIKKMRQQRRIWRFDACSI